MPVVCRVKPVASEEVVRTVDAVKKDDDSADPPKRCAHCDSQASLGEKLVRCAACSQVRYCGR
jgi:hypothetical protein